MVRPSSNLAKAIGILIALHPIQTRAQTSELQPTTWAATDELGRKLPGFAECGPPRSDRFVGIFYFLWHLKSDQDLYNNEEILAEEPAHPVYGPVRSYHYWGQPWLGYYQSADPFVIRIHAQQLVEAGVDTLIFDTTNGPTWDDQALALCRVYEDMRKAGQPTPQIAYFMHADAQTAVQHVYDLIYSKGLYKDLWFYWKGKPLLIAPIKDVSPQIASFFTIRESWAFNDGGWFGDGKDKWKWIDFYPQQPGWHEDPSKPEELSVAVASHPTLNIGRSFHNGVEPPPNEQNPAIGLDFAEQWRRALEVDPEFVFVTGWNEWIAGKFLNPGGVDFLGKRLAKGDPFFVDEYSPEFSRDAEPMSGDFGDNYYYQLVANIRKYKGIAAPLRPSGPKTLSIDGDFRQWANVAPEYRDFVGDAAHRFFPGFGHLTYLEQSGRNDFELMKVARDDKYVFFYARTAQPITKPAKPTWMTILIDADRNHATGWEGYDFAVNREIGWLERNMGGWHWAKICPIRYKVRGNEIQVAVPRSALGMTRKLDFEFKWIDDVPEWGRIMDFIDKGDVAPDGRFNYVYSPE